MRDSRLPPCPRFPVLGLFCLGLLATASAMGCSGRGYDPQSADGGPDHDLFVPRPDAVPSSERSPADRWPPDGSRPDGTAFDGPQDRWSGDVRDQGPDLPTDLPPIRVPAQHRAVATVCDQVRPPSSLLPPPGSTVTPDGYISCLTDADCASAGKNGRCTGNGHDGWRCTYDGCFSDGDCSGSVCQCEGGFRSDNNVCLSQGNCRVDADCGPGGYCSPTLGDCGDYGGVVGYYCHTSTDECIDDSDCGAQPGTFGQPYCAYSPAAGRWKCSTQQCAG